MEILRKIDHQDTKAARRAAQRLSPGGMERPAKLLRLRREGLGVLGVLVV
jgi:hypothetical protein